MAIEPSILANPMPEVSVTQSAPATVTQTTSFAADAPVGGVIAQVETAAAGNPNALLLGAGMVIAVILGAFVYLLIAAVSANSGIAQHYLANIFTSTAVWIVVAGVLLGAGYLANVAAKK